MPSPLRRPATLADTAAEAVRQMVREGRLTPGELYSVHQLADWLGMSRSPAREALLRLAEAGLVTFERNRGFRVQVPGAQDIAEIFAVRLALEPPAAATAADALTEQTAGALRAATKRLHEASGDESAYWPADRDLHEAVLLAAGNRRVVQIVRSQREALRLIGLRTTGERSLPEVAHEHEPIVAAILAGDASAAQTSMRRHLEHTRDLLLQLHR